MRVEELLVPTHHRAWYKLKSNHVLFFVGLKIRFVFLLHSMKMFVLLQDDVEAQMRRLRLELKQTMDMYSSACREALTARHEVIIILYSYISMLFFISSEIVS